MNEGCPAYVEKRTITPADAARIIRKARGKVVLAHPVAYIHQDNLTDKDISEIVQEMNADGIEANYVFLDRNRKKFNESERWNKFAKEHNLLATVGSDFHNNDEFHSKIGLINEDVHLTDEEIDYILNTLTK